MCVVKDRPPARRALALVLEGNCEAAEGGLYGGLAVLADDSGDWLQLFSPAAGIVAGLAAGRRYRVEVSEVGP